MRLASLARKEHQELAVRCRALAESMLDEHGQLPLGLGALRHELEEGWLAVVASGEGDSEENVGA